jgi:DNA-binding NtrC family response regulator
MNTGKVELVTIPRKLTTSGLQAKTLPEIMSTYERIVIIQALQLNNFSRTLTAVSLGIRRNHLYQRMKILKINLLEIPSSPGRPRKKVLDLKV